jgi:multidrug efflux pump subunit AcrA (membrane-fusion protein)
MNNIKIKITEFFKKIIASKFIQAIKTFSIAHKVWASVITLAIIVGLYFGFAAIFKSGSTIQYTFGKVTRGDLVVSVSGSGQVATLSKVSIKPNTTGQTQTLGQIISVKVQNGDTVKAGQVVAVLDGKNALQTLNQARASYNKLVKGLSDASLLSLNNSITSAQTSLDNAKQNILISLKSAYTSASNAVYINTDQFFPDPTINPTIKINGVGFNNQEIVNNINQERFILTTTLNNWRDKIKTQSTSDDLVASINSSISDLNTIRNYFDDMTTLFALYSVSSDSSSQSALNSAKSTASGARSNIDSSISSLTSTLQSYNNSIFSLKNAKDNFTVQQEPPSADDLAVAQANLTNAEIAYASRIITAPFDGQIGGLTTSVGQQVSSSDSLGTLITSEKVINVTLNEVDAAKISAGNPVTITYDSLPNVTMTGKVSYMDPLGTVTSGVVSYSVQISMDSQNDQIKTGMTATVAIVTTQHTNTLIIPTSAITMAGGKKYVLVADMSSSTGQFGNFNSGSSTRNFASSSMRNFASSTRASSTRQLGSSTRTAVNSGITTQFPVTRIEITIGISNNTSTEVLTGLTEGQLIVTKKSTVTSTTAKTSASSATTNSRSGFGGGFGGGAVGGITGGSGATFIRGN